MYRPDDRGLPAALVDSLRRATPTGHLQEGTPLSTLTRWKIGGPAALTVEPGDERELAAVLEILSNESYPVCVIGDGSNVLFDTIGFDGVVLIVGRRFSSLRIDGLTVSAGAGIATPDLARAVGRAGLSGIEHTVGVPGTLGGLVLMNGGSLRQGIGSHVVSVRCLDEKGAPIDLSGEECQFGYRSSRLQAMHAVVVEVVLRLEPGDTDVIESRMDKIVADRAAKFPLDLPNCGSTFVSDPDLYETIGPPGKAIEAVGLKGASCGDMQISLQHANFFVNRGHSSSDDALWLIALARNAVRKATGIAMECEVRYVSPRGTMSPAHEEAENRWGAGLTAVRGDG